MASQTFSKFIRPEIPTRGEISNRDLDILEAVLRYRFCSAAHLVRLVGGNEDVTQRRLRRLWEWQLLNRFAFPGIRTHSEFYYYLDNRQALELLADRRGLELQDAMLEEIRGHREKDYAGAAARGQHMQLGFLNHALMISRFHFMLEMACRKSAGAVNLRAWHQGAPLTKHKVEVPKIRSSRQGDGHFWEEQRETVSLPVEPDGLFTVSVRNRPQGQELSHFLYEADRGTMNLTDMMSKMRALHYFIKRQQKHREVFGIHPIRAVLIETTTEQRARKLMQLAEHPLVSGTKRAGLFWFCISPVFTTPEARSGITEPRRAPTYLYRPEIVMDPIWALPDRTLHMLLDPDNTATR